MVRLTPLLQLTLTGDTAGCLCPYCDAMALRCRRENVHGVPYEQPLVNCMACGRPVTYAIVADVIETTPAEDDDDDYVERLVTDGRCDVPACTCGADLIETAELDTGIAPVAGARGPNPRVIEVLAATCTVCGEHVGALYGMEAVETVWEARDEPLPGRSDDTDDEQLVTDGGRDGPVPGETIVRNGEVIGTVAEILPAEDDWTTEWRGREIRHETPRRVRIDPVAGLTVDDPAFDFLAPVGGQDLIVHIERGEFRASYGLERCVECGQLAIDETRTSDPVWMPAATRGSSEAECDGHGAESETVVRDDGHVEVVNGGDW